MSMIKHDSHNPPALAPAAWVECIDGPNGWVDTVARVDWCPGIEYQPLTAADGVPLCSPKGLDAFARYVVTTGYGTVAQTDLMPERVEGTWMPTGSWCEAPETHRHPGSWQESLYRVWERQGIEHVLRA